MGGFFNFLSNEEEQPFYGPTNEELGYVPPSNWSWDQFLPTISQGISDVGSSVYDIFAKPSISAAEQAQKDMYEALQKEGLDRASGILGTLGKGAYNLGTGIVNEAFGSIQEPVNRAAAYYSDLPQALGEDVPSISELGGGSLRDLAEAGKLEETIGLPNIINPITNPYALETIEKGGGELLEELSDPTNIPGALVGAGRLLGKGASNIDKILAGMGTISGFSGGIPALASGGEQVLEEGFSPEAYGKLLEGTIGAGFGGLSAAGLASGGNPNAPGAVESIGNVLAPESTLGPEAGVFEFGKGSIEDAQRAILEGDIRKDIGEAVPKLEPDYESILRGDPFNPTKTQPINVSGITQPIDVGSVESAFNESQQNALNAKVGALQNLGFGSETIGGLTSDQANDIISGQTQREDFNPNQSYVDKLQDIMRMHNVDENFASEILAKEGIYPEPGDVEEANIVYHGTPYDFDAFDLSKIGTGEGAQAYGHGFYFAENPNVAADYAKKLAPAGYRSSSIDRVNTLLKNKTKDQALVEIQDEITKAKARLGDSSYNQNSYQDHIDYLEEVEGMLKGEGVPKSNIISAQIPHPDEFLDYDKPLGEQSEKVKAAIPDVIQKAERYEPNLIKAAHDVQASIPAIEKLGNVDKELLTKLKENLNDYLETGSLTSIDDTEAALISLNDDLRYTSIQKPIKDVLDNLRESITTIRLQDSATGSSRVLDTLENTEKLREQGLKGIKYLDRQSRNFVDNSEKIKDVQEQLNYYNNLKFTGPVISAKVDQLNTQLKLLQKQETTRNYVVFDPKDIKILEKTKDITKENLQKFINQVKAKHGKRWKKKLSPKESKTISDMQIDIMEKENQIQAAKKVPESQEKTSPAYKESYEKGELPEHYTENLEVPKKEDLEKAKQDIKAKVQAIGPAPTSIPLVSQASIPPVSPIQNLSQPQIPNVSPPGQNLPPSEPPKKTPPSKEPPKKPEVLKLLSAVRSATRSTIENIKHINPKIGRLVEAYDREHSTNTSKDIYRIHKATQGLSKESESRVVNFLDGQSIKLNPKEQSIAKELRSLLDDIANKAESEGVLVGYRQGYFPRKYDNKFEWDYHFQLKDLTRRSDLGSIPSGHLEKSRTSDRQDFRRDFKVLEEYANEAERRIAEAKYLGKEPGDLIENFRGSDKNTLNYLRTALKRITGREASSRVSKTGDVLRKVVALGDLTLAQIYQPAQITHTASLVGLRRSIKALSSLATNFKGEKLNALRSGALWPNISHEVSKAIGDKGYLHGIPTMDKVMRIHANITGRILLQDAMKGNKGALRKLNRLGLNTKSGADIIGKAIADKTQFRTGTLDMPLWTHSTAGKMVSQYSSFMYAHSRFVLDMFKKPVINLPQILRFGALGVLAGEAVGDLREIIRSLIPGDDEDDEMLKRALEAAAGEDLENDPWYKKLQAATRNKRIGFDSPGWRALQNLSLVGGVGIFQNILEKASDPRKYWQIPIGPALSQVVETGQAAGKDIEKMFKEEELTFPKNLSKEALKNLPVTGVSGYKLAGKVFPPERKGRSMFGSF